MDELLELMEADDVPAPLEEEGSVDHNNSDDCNGCGDNDNDGGMDELASLMFDDETPGPSQQQQTAKAEASTRDTNRTNRDKATAGKRKNNPPTRKSAVATKTKPVEASVDVRLGIRMLNRLVSSNDLLELITDHPYFSPASLSAMPLAKLNTLLLDPTRIVDPATVAGKTNLVTVGLVFSNCGTRISAKGGGFCVLTVGNFASGPCLTIFLFGDAYGKYCRTCTAGKVVAIMGPKLLPCNRKDSKSNQYNDNAVSFSVYESGQLQIVANARDYGTCKGKVRVKQPDGTWSSNGHCKQYVDKRVSDYCPQHRRQQLKASAVAIGSSRNNKPINKFQQLKVQAVRPPQAMVQSTMMRNVPNQAPASTSTNRFLNATTNNMAVSRMSSSLPLTNNVQTKPASNLGRNVPMHMKKQVNPPLVERRANANATAVQRLKNKRMNGTTSNVAATTQSSSNAAATNKFPSATAKRPRSTPVTGDWLPQAANESKKAMHTAKSSSKSLSAYMKHGSKAGRAGRVNTDGQGFDGSVIVPKPSKIFQGKEPTTFAKKASASSGPSLAEKQQQLLQKQAALARQRKEGMVSGTTETAATQRLHNRQRPGRDKVSERDAVLEMLGDIDHEKVRNAKSRFSSEIEAEEYAASRQKILALEKMEERKTKSDANKSKDDEKRLTKEWRCKNCARNFSFKPKGCYKAGHEIVTVRKIRKEATKEESRSQMHSKQVDDGGLQLGAGLEWSDRFGRSKHRFVT